MVNWRVVRQWYIEEWRYTIEDVLPVTHYYANTHPFVQHVGAGARSVEDLKAELKAKLCAFNLPVLELTLPKLREAK